MPVIVIRPEPGCSRTVASGRALGLQMFGYPLFVAEPVAWNAPQARYYDGLLIGSANALRHGGSQLERLKHLPAHVVGAATAAKARELGFTVARAGEGRLQSVLDRFARSNKRLLRLAGEARIELTPVAGVSIDTVTLYRVMARPFDDELCRLIEREAIVLLHSGEAAIHFTAECSRLGIDRTRLSLAVLGARIAALAGPGWNEIAVAARPNDGELLALAAKMCQTPVDPAGRGYKGSTV